MAINQIHNITLSLTHIYIYIWQIRPDQYNSAKTILWVANWNFRFDSGSIAKSLSFDIHIYYCFIIYNHYCLVIYFYPTNKWKSIWHLIYDTSYEINNPPTKRLKIDKKSTNIEMYMAWEKEPNAKSSSLKRTY